MEAEKNKAGLDFLGIGSAFNTDQGNNSAYILKESALLLIDCGSSVFHRLKSAVFLPGIKQVDILLTHLHPDHAGSVGDLIFYLAHIVGLRPTLHFPAGDDLVELLKLQGVRKEYYELNTSEEFITGEVSIRFLPQDHSPSIKSFGFLLKTEGFSCFYSGDSRKLNSVAFELLKKGEIDLFYQDTCSYKIEGAGHMYIGDLAESVPLEYREKIICMHIDEDFDRKKAEEMGFKVAAMNAETIK